ncbi:MAG: adenosine deaminase [Alphaproteobacteria bacterium]
MEKNLREFIIGMPKTELHVHIEGTLEPENQFILARRNNIDLPYDNVEQLKAAYDFNNLQEFLDLYYQGMSVLQTEQDFYDLTCAYMQKFHEQNGAHTEIFFDPQGHTQRGIDIDTVFQGILRALHKAEQNLGVTSRLIPCFLRHLSEEEAFEMLEQVKPYMEYIEGFGLDSSENGNPPEKFARVFAKVKSLGKKIFVHAGEEGPAEYVRQAINILQADRIDHGNRSLEDHQLVEYLARSGVGLTVCPLSNLKLCVVDCMENQPLNAMLGYGLKATVNSDDPAYFGGYITENFLAVAEALKLTRAQIITLARNAIDVSCQTPAEKRQQHLALDAYIERFEGLENRPSAQINIPRANIG